MLQGEVVALAKALLEHLDQPPVGLDGGDMAGGLQHQPGQRAKPGADLDHWLVGGELGQADDFAELILVMHESLAKRLGQQDVLVVEDIADLGEVHA